MEPLNYPLGRIVQALMTISLSTFFLLLVIATFCALLGKVMSGKPRGGVLVSIVFGFAGAYLAPWFARSLKLPQPLAGQVDGQPFSIVWAVVGAAFFVSLLHMVSKRYDYKGHA